MTKKPYIVALQFGLPPNQTQLCVNGVVGPTTEMAVAVTTAAIIQGLGITEPLTGYATQELTEEFLVVALNAVRGRPEEGGVVVSLVTKPEHAEQVHLPGDDGAVLLPPREAEVEPHGFYPDLSIDGRDECLFCHRPIGDPFHVESA